MENVKNCKTKQKNICSRVHSVAEATWARADGSVEGKERRNQSEKESFVMWWRKAKRKSWKVEMKAKFLFFCAPHKLTTTKIAFVPWRRRRRKRKTTAQKTPCHPSRGTFFAISQFLRVNLNPSKTQIQFVNFCALPRRKKRVCERYFSSGLIGSSINLYRNHVRCLPMLCFMATELSIVRKKPSQSIKNPMIKNCIRLDRVFVHSSVRLFFWYFSSSFFFQNYLLAHPKKHIKFFPKKRTTQPLQPIKIYIKSELDKSV